MAPAQRQCIVIHSGAYKTATSAVQTTLFAHRDRLLSEQGVLVPETYASRLAGVPDPYAFSHNRLGHLVAACKAGYEGADDRLRESLATLVTEVRESDAQRAIVTSEMLTDIGEREAGLIRDALIDFDLRVVYTVRRADEYFESMALQTLKLDLVFDLHEPPFSTPFGGLLRWAEVLGDDALTVQVYGFPRRSDAVAQTLEALGLDHVEALVGENPMRNPTLRADGYVLRRLLTELAASATRRPVRRPTMEAIIARSYDFDASRTHPKPLVAYSAAERRRMLDDTRPIHAQIGERFLDVDARAAFLGTHDGEPSFESDGVPMWTAEEVGELAEEVVAFLRAEPGVLAALDVDSAVRTQARRAAKRAAERESDLLAELEFERAARSRAAADVEARERRLQQAYDSKSYRLGHAVLTPLRLVKGVIRRISRRSAS